MTRRSLLITISLALLLALSVWFVSSTSSSFLSAALGIGRITGVNVPTGSNNLRESIGGALRFIMTFATLAALVTVIASGFFLILGFGTETSTQRAKKILIYTLVGLLVLFFARVIVAFFTEELAGVVS